MFTIFQVMEMDVKQNEYEENGIFLIGCKMCKCALRNEYTGLAGDDNPLNISSLQHERIMAKWMIHMRQTRYFSTKG